MVSGMRNLQIECAGLKRVWTAIAFLVVPGFSDPRQLTHLSRPHFNLDPAIETADFADVRR